MQQRRILDHPILGRLPDAPPVHFRVDGIPVVARRGETIAAALTAAGYTALRTTEKHQRPRGVFCAIGRCTDCVMTVNGIPNVRTCITLVEEGMEVTTQEGLGQWRI